MQNVISGNRANGIDLLNSSQVSIIANMIGTEADGNVATGNVTLGNSSNGVFLNESSNNTIGGSTALTPM